MGKPIEFTDTNFEQEVLQSDIPVLVDFWAVWCAPCNMIAPVVEELANEYDEKIKFGKLNVDNNQTTAAKFGIRSIPMLLIFKNGEVFDHLIGVHPKKNIVEKLEAVQQ